VSHRLQREVTGDQRNTGQRASINYSDSFGCFFLVKLRSTGRSKWEAKQILTMAL